ncbi:MAG: complement resistance protein TraT [Nitrospira sp.]|nr:complement resistance protein TraT [Nitrospira sp.]
MKDFSTFILPVVLPALIAGCASDPEWSKAAKEQQTATGIRIGPDAGVPEKPSVEYIRVRMTDTVFLDPPEVDNPGIFLRVRNTSGREALDLHTAVAPRLQALGYRLVNNAKDAVYAMQANILFADEVSAAELAKLDETEFGTDVASIVTGATVGGVLGAAGGALLEGSKGAAIGGAAGAVLGGLSSGLADNARKERLKAKQLIKFYSLVVDIQLRERSKGSVEIAGSSGLSAERPSGGGAFSEHSAYSRQETQSYSETSDWKRYQTRIVGKAKGKLIVFDDVEPDFVDRLARSIAGLF